MDGRVVQAGAVVGAVEDLDGLTVGLALDGAGAGAEGAAARGHGAVGVGRRDSGCGGEREAADDGEGAHVDRRWAAAKGEGQRRASASEAGASDRGRPFPERTRADILELER